MTAMAASRMAWYSRSVSVCAGATVMESPVCTPMAIEILDRADDDDVVGQIAHHLQLELLPAEHGFFDQHFVHGREVEAARQQFQQLFAVVGDAAAGAAQGERRTQDHRKAELAGELQAVFQVVDQRRARHLETDAASWRP